MIQFLQQNYISSPEKTAFILHETGLRHSKTLTYNELAGYTELLAIQLIGRNLYGKTAILVYDHPFDFIISFLACQYAGIIPIPVLFTNSKRQIEKISHIHANSQADIILASETLESLLEKKNSLTDGTFNGKIYYTPNKWDELIKPTFEKTRVVRTSFIQYTSGSTYHPKGVVISHSNLVNNHTIIQNVFNTNSESILFSWLPFQHDMGLIGFILHNIYIGGTCVLMSPFSFTQQPLNWLLGITKYRATHSAAPNFAYDYCVNRISPSEFSHLDLSSWRYALNGSEPLRPGTLQRFAEFFAPAGFQMSSFFPCYGLAEATLVVSGAKEAEAPIRIITMKNESSMPGSEVVSCGKLPAGVSVVICLNGTICGAGEEGEIMVAGDSITSGYLNGSEEDLFIWIQDKKYLRTGDLGLLDGDELFVSGRMDEMFVIRGHNVYPYDIEGKLAGLESAIDDNGVAIFFTEHGPARGVVVIAELKRSASRSISLENLISAIDGVISEHLALAPVDIVIVPYLGIPRTTSGKIRRLECRKLYESQELKALSFKRMKVGPTVRANAEYERDGADETQVRQYLIDLIALKTGNDVARQAEINSSIFTMGVDSLKLVELVNTISDNYQIYLDVSAIMQDTSFNGIVQYLEHQINSKLAAIHEDKIEL